MQRAAGTTHHRTTTSTEMTKKGVGRHTKLDGVHTRQPGPGYHSQNARFPGKIAAACTRVPRALCSFWTTCLQVGTVRARDGVETPCCAVPTFAMYHLPLSFAQCADFLFVVCLSSTLSPLPLQLGSGLGRHAQTQLHSSPLTCGRILVSLSSTRRISWELGH